MADALAGLVLEKLALLAVDQASLLLGVKSEISKLERKVLVIKAVLTDAEKQSSRDNRVQLWLQELEEVLYDAEDVLDDFSTEVLRRKQMDGSRVVNEVRRFCSSSNPIAYGFKIANQIKDIRGKLEEISQNMKQFNFQQLCTMEPVDQGWRQTHSSPPEVVVGREEDKQIVIDMLLSSDYKEKVAVVPIVGIGGLGKTTLAQQVYNDDIMKSRFACKVWVCVSENFDPKLLVKNILESITKRKVEDLEVNTLKDLLQEEIRNKRLLLVLDDVWNEDKEKWDRFMNILSSGATGGSRIVVTTRQMTVAKITATETIVPHELQGLSEVESRSLFKKMAFKEGVAPGPRYVEIGELVVSKCRGVPLAIRTMGGLLYYKETESEWEAIRDKQQLLSLDHPDGQKSDILERTLKLSYDNLPSNLKRCFAYCSLFPKDHKIDVEMLIQLWMAQGYITNSSPSSPPEYVVGVEHFKNLLWRSFFQEVTQDMYGNIESCKMHDLMHDLAVRVSGEEIICLNASNLTDGLLSSGDVNLEKIRHLSIDFENRQDIGAWQVPSLLAKATRLRTFLIINIFHYGGVTLEGRCAKIFPKMTRLRVLGLRRAKMESLSSSIIHKLKHLRYLDLSWDKEMETLPKEITRLVNLQVLDLSSCGNLRLLPLDIAKLSNLVYLDIGDCDMLSCMPAGIGSLSFLRELTDFVVAEAGAARAAAGLGELKSLNNLSGELTIRGLERVKDKLEAEAANLKEKSQLQCLDLRWMDDDEDEENNRGDRERSVLEALQPHPNLKELRMWRYGGTSIPTTSSNCWFFSLRNLVQIELHNCGKLRSLPSLDPLVSLQELGLWGLESLEYLQSETVAASSSSSSPSSSSSQFLPSLESLRIHNCPNLRGWSPTNTNTQDDESPLLPRVSTLEITGCPKMVSVPRFLVNFETVMLWDAISELLSAFAASLISPPSPTDPQRFWELELSGVKGDLPPGLMPQLTSLEILEITGCADFTTLSPSILRHLPSLQELQIAGCEVLELKEDDYGSDGDDVKNNKQLPPLVLPSLRLFMVVELPKLVTLPKWLQHCSNLQQLGIDRCHNLESLPSWLTNLTALESLKVERCHLVSGRCRSNTAEDWPYISHIPNILIDTIDVQKGGRYVEMEQQQQQERQQQQEQEQLRLRLQEASPHTQIPSRVIENIYLIQRYYLPQQPKH